MIRSILAGLAALVVLVAGLVALPASAHHGWSEYLEEETTLTGTVEEASFGNPHGVLAVRIDGQLWNAVLGPPFRLQRAGVDEEAVGVGDEVTLHGHRHRDEGTLEIKVEQLEARGKLLNIYPNRD